MTRPAPAFDTPGSAAADRAWRLAAAAAFVAGAFFRLWDLGGAPLAVDEYFLGTSMLNVLEHGLPDFPCAGYYTRGLLVQYLGVPLLMAGASVELATRFWPAVASLATIAAVWRIGRLCGGVPAAALATILASLSLWEIEFARFGRMYAPFQAVFAWYVYFQLRHLVQGSNAARWSYIALSALSVFVYAGSSFLLIMNFLALVWREKRWSVAHVVVSAALLVAGTLFYTTEFRFLGVPPEALPPRPDREGAPSLPINLPPLPELAWPLALVGTALLVACLLAWRRSLRPRHPSALYWLLALVAACFGSFGLALPLVVAGLLLRLPSPFVPGSRAPASAARLLAVAVPAWLALAAALFAAGPGGIGAGIEGALRYVLGWPDLFRYVLWPWLSAIPVTTVMLLVPALLQVWALLVTERDREGPAWSAQRYCAGAIVLLLLLAALFRQPYAITRYTYFLYPLILVLVSASLVYWSSRLFRRPAARAAAIAVPLLVLLAPAEDFGLVHLLRINDPEYRFRMAYPRELGIHYYQRWDFRAAAEYVNERLAPDDTVIVFDQPLPHYLVRTSGVFVRAGTTNHRLVWGCGGTRDLWSNAPLLDTPWELERLAAATRGDVWLIVRTEAYPSRDPLEVSLPERLALPPAFTTVDGHLAVYRFPGGPLPTGEAQAR